MMRVINTIEWVSQLRQKLERFSRRSLRLPAFAQTRAGKPTYVRFLRIFTAVAIAGGSLSLHAVQLEKRQSVFRPACNGAAPLKGKFSAQTPGFVVVYKGRSPALVKVTEDLARKYGFEVDKDFSAEGAFYSKKLTPSQVSKLRCEKLVAHVEYYTGAPLSNR